jgi:hypothetical protein
MKMKIKIILMALIVLMIPFWVFAAEQCRIVGPEAVLVASKIGFQFRVNKVSEKGHCHKLEKGNAMLCISAGENEPVICEATFFSDMKLHNKWKIVQAPKFNGNFQYIKGGKPKFGTNDPKFTVRVESKEEMCMLELESITLQGPDCDKWKTAFEGGS